MDIRQKQIIVEVTLRVPIQEVWEKWTTPSDIMQWSHASDDWHTPKVENDLRVGGKFLSRIEAKDGSAGFDFTGTYDEVRQHEYIAYTMSDSRKVSITFFSTQEGVKITEAFDPEEENTTEIQRDGWQAFLDNFKKYAEKGL